MHLGRLYERGVCRKSVSVCLLPLVGHERISAVKIIESIIPQTKPTALLMRSSLPACEISFIKLNLVQPSTSRKTSPISRMHFKPPSPAEEVTTASVEEKEFKPEYYHPTDTSGQALGVSQDQASGVQSTAEACTNDYHCACAACQNKYGCLPLLLQGIEQQYETESQPSTSGQTASSRRTLSCEYCKKTFTHKGDFNKHLRKHTREKPFSCTVCDRKFAHTSNLLRHQRLHTGDRPYVCEQCDKSFSRKDKLDSHKRSRMCQGRTSAELFQ